MNVDAAGIFALSTHSTSSTAHGGGGQWLFSGAEAWSVLVEPPAFDKGKAVARWSQFNGAVKLEAQRRGEVFPQYGDPRGGVVWGSV